MTRASRAVVARAKHKKILKRAKGYYGARSRVYRVAKQAVIKADQYAYRDRKCRKRNFRRLWIIRINAATNQHGLSYSRFIAGLTKLNIIINRKILAHLCATNEEAFTNLVNQVKQLAA